MKKIVSPIQQRELLVDFVKKLASKPIMNLMEAAERITLLMEIHRIFIEKLDEMNALLDKKVGPKGEAGKDGKNGERGKDGQAGLTPEIDYALIIKEASRLVPKPKHGEQGKDGYSYTKEEMRAMVKSLIPKIDLDQLAERASKKIKPKILENSKDIPDALFIDKFLKLLEEGKMQLNTKHVTGLDQTMKAFSNQLGRGYLHGGGDTVKAGSNITIIRNSDGTTTIASNAAGLSILIVTGTVNDANTSFTVASTPTLVVINGGIYPTTGGAITWTYVGTTLTLSSPVGTGGNIFALG